MTKVSDIPLPQGLPVSPAKQSVSANDDNNKDFLAMMANTTNDVFAVESAPSVSLGAGKDNDLGSTNGSDFLDFNVSDSSKATRIEKSDNSNGKPVISKQDSKKIKDAVQKFEDDVKTAIKEELNVSEEQIESAMETLGLTYVDLSDPANLAKLIGELSGSEDTVNLLTSTAFTDLIEDVNTFSAELVEITGVKMEDIKAVSTDKVDVAALGMEVLDTPSAIELENEPIVIETESNKVILNDSIDKKADISNRELPGEEVEDSEVMVGKEVEKTNTDNTKMNNSQQDASSNNQGTKQPVQTQENNTGVRADSTPSFQQVNVETVEAAPEVNTYVSVDTQNVIEQIVSAARTQITATVRSMELELNPMNLGRMLMQVTEENGQITARIFTQNEAVKEALESQMALLKDQLNEQGIKVEAVEISVATHEFEQNLEDGQDSLLQDELARQQEEENKKSRRGINLGDPELMGEEPLSEEDELTARIMKDEGNMVNFRA